MNPETQGKLMVAMLISILAFGTGTGTVLITGLNHNQNSLNTLNTTKQSEFPIIYNTNQNNLDTQNTQNTEQNIDQTTGGNNGQSNGQTNNNNPSGNYNNTTN